MSRDRETNPILNAINLDLLDRIQDELFTHGPRQEDAAHYIIHHLDKSLRKKAEKFHDLERLEDAHGPGLVVSQEVRDALAAEGLAPNLVRSEEVDASAILERVRARNKQTEEDKNQ